MITALDREAFSAVAWPLIGRKVSKARLINDIYETASASTALPVPEDSAAITMFRMVIAQGRSLIHQRDEIERLAHARLADDVEYQLLRNIPGIGPINALTILAEAGDLRRFNHHRQFLKFCGLDLATWSVRRVPRPHQAVQNTANARLRRTLWMAAQVARVSATTASAISSDGTPPAHAGDADRRRKAMTALTAKMARVAHAVVKTGTEYRPFLERPDARWKDPLSASAVRALASDPVDNVRAFHLGAYLVLRTVRTTVAPAPLDPVFAMAGSDPVDGGSHLAQIAYRADGCRRLDICWPKPAAAS